MSIWVEIHEYGRRRTTPSWRVCLIYEAETLVATNGPVYQPIDQISRGSAPTGNFNTLTYDTYKSRENCPEGYIVPPTVKQVDDPRAL